MTATTSAPRPTGPAAVTDKAHRTLRRVHRSTHHAHPVPTLRSAPGVQLDLPSQPVEAPAAGATGNLKGVAVLVRDLVLGTVPFGVVRAALPGRAAQRGPGHANAHAVHPHAALLAQMLSFVGVGALCTSVYALLYLTLSNPWGDQTANFAAQLVAAVLNTALNRRHTFGVRGREGAARHHGQGLLVFGLGWGLTSGALALLGALVPGASHVLELGVLCLANLAATALRFLLFRFWVFGSRDPACATR
ncbi:GtrA family protein [Luteimicrobium sp. NPDC057192]|uniref:GtrA family protein n=1 Tax=Luteimicrobium sp. NPDC057192 TaxID=3346042 RepID=UPI0036280C1F